MRIDGSCHCGAISYEAEIDPEDVYACHCSDCQSISGGAFRWAVPVAEANFSLLSGTPKAYVKRGDSGAENHQMFCGDCASPIYSKSIGDMSGTVRLRLGTARQRADLPPKSQYWCRSGQTWLSDLASLARTETQ